MFPHYQRLLPAPTRHSYTVLYYNSTTQFESYHFDNRRECHWLETRYNFHNLSTLYIHTCGQHSGSTLLFGCFGVSLGYSQPQSTNKLVSPFMTVHLFTHYFSDDLLVLNRPGLLVLDGMVTLPGADITTRQKDTFETMFWTFFKKQLQSKQQNWKLHAKEASVYS